MAFPGEIGWIGKRCPYHPALILQTRILRSGAGYFVATQCSLCSLEDPSPHSRESHYYDTREEIELALFAGTVRWRDTDYHPGPLIVERV